MTCSVDKQEMIDERVSRVLTQYRESPRLLHMINTYLSVTFDVWSSICDLPSFFDINTCVGDQLTILGKRLGFPRCHCICDSEPVFGFECDETVSLRPVVGFGATVENRKFGFCDDEVTAGFNGPFNITWDSCDQSSSYENCVDISTWEACSSGLSDIRISNDELYRAFLKVRCYQIQNRYDITSLTACIRILFGPEAFVIQAGHGRVVINPGRELTTTEVLLLQVYPRVLPLALGVKLKFSFQEKRVFGFGDGWGGFLESELSGAYDITGKVFGFEGGERADIGGFCETSIIDPTRNIVTHGSENVVTELGLRLIADYNTQDAAWQCAISSNWLCEVDIEPYTC